MFNICNSVSITRFNTHNGNQVIVMSTVDRLWAGWLRNYGLIPGKGWRFFVFSEAFTLSVGTTKLLVQRVSGCFSWG